MSDLIELGNNVSTVDVSPEFDAYTKVVINIDDDVQVVAGDDTGLTLEFDNPFGNQAMADRILASLNGFHYSPYTANGALLDPAAEIGDAVETTTSFGGIYTRYRNFGRMMKADISAPCDEEIDKEYKFEAPTERKFKRQVGEVKASLILTNNAIEAEVARATQAEGNLSATLSLQADQISAKVSAQGGNNTSGSFSWKLTASGHNWYANGSSTPVMSVTKDGLTVNGIVNAKAGGTIGGFSIGATAIFKNITQFGESKTNGVYVGTDGIQLGNNFKVTTSGAVTASNLSLKGTLTFLNSDGSTAGTMSAADLKTGAEQAYNNYGSWNSAYSSVTPGGFCYGGASGGYSYNKAAQRDSSNYPSGFTCGTLYHKGRFMQFNGYACQLINVTIDNRNYSFIGRYG